MDWEIKDSTAKITLFRQCHKYSVDLEPKEHSQGLKRKYKKPNLAMAIGDGYWRWRWQWRWLLAMAMANGFSLLCYLFSVLCYLNSLTAQRLPHRRFGHPPERTLDWNFVLHWFSDKRGDKSSHREPIPLREKPSYNRRYS